MTRLATHLLAIVVALLATRTSAPAADQLVAGTKIGLKVDSQGREKLTFQSKGTFAIPVASSGDDPRQVGATLQLVNPNTNESFTFSLPSNHWSANSAGTSFRYRDSIPVESGAVRSAVIGGRKLKVAGRKVGITLNEQSQGTIGVVLTIGTFRYCAVFGPGSVTVDTPGRFSARQALAPSSCPAGTPATTTTIASSTTTTTVAPGSTTTTTTPEETTTTTTTTVPVTTTTSSTIPLPPLGQVVLTIQPGTTDCGGPGFSPPAAPPTTGHVDSATTTLGNLGLGCLYIGGPNASALPAVSLADGASSVLDVVGIAGLALTLGGSDGSGPADCTRGSGPDRHCLNGSPGTDMQGACATDDDCGGQIDSCALDANCFFGPPLPQGNIANPSTSTCIINAIAADVTGTADLLSGGSTANAALAARIYLTGDAISPCPRCVSGQCTAGPRQGLSCSGGVGSKGTSIECPPDPLLFVGTLSPTLALSTGTESLADPAGHFCPDQSGPGAFGRFTSRVIEEQGSPLLSNILNPMATTLAGVFCVPASGSPLVNALADLPGPAAISVPGMISIQIDGFPF